MITNIPGHLVLLIYRYLGDISNILSASASCKCWREVLLSSSKIKLKKRQTISFICKTRGKTASEQELENTLKFINHIETLIFEWSICQRGKMMCLFEKLVTRSNVSVKQICIKPRNTSMCFKSCKKYLDSNCVDKVSDYRFAELFVLLLNHCVKLETLDFGFGSHLAIQQNHIEETIDKLSRQSLSSLNVCYFPYQQRNTHLQLGRLIHSNTISTLCLNWDNHFVKLISQLLVNDSSQSRLRQLVVIVSSVSCSTLCSLEYNDWAKLTDLYSNLKLKLVIVEDCDVPEVYNELCHLPSNLPLQALTFISQDRCAVASTNMRLSLKDYMNSVTEISIQNVELQREHETSSFDFLFTDFKLEKLQRLEICGFFIENITLMRIVLKFGKQLKNLVVYQADVVHESTVTGYLIPLTKAQIYGLERGVTDMLGVDWKLVKTRHINRSFKMRDSPLSNIQCVLQDVCCVTES